MTLVLAQLMLVGTVAQLPTCSTAMFGLRAVITDSTEVLLGSKIRGAGYYRVRARCDGVWWRSMGPAPG